MRKKLIEDSYLNDHLASLSDDAMTIFVLRRGNYRGAFVHGTRMLNEMRHNHEYGVMETFIVGHAYLGAALLASGLKGIDRVGMHLDCRGPAGGVSVEATAEGAVRGYLEDAPLNLVDVFGAGADSALPPVFDMSPFLGDGVLSVTRKLQDAKQPYVGRVEMAYGNIAQDLANYHRQSEQKPSAYNLSTRFDDEGRLIGAAGLSVQAFPDSEDDHAEALDARVRSLPSLGKLVADGADAEELIEEHFADFEPVVAGHRAVNFYCHCSKERFGRFLAAMPLEEIRDIRDNGPFPLQTRCHNCNTIYEFTREDIEKAFQMAR